MSINLIQIDNFQSHKNTIIEFNKGVNIITGTSDSGKSAIIRALLWVIQNRPLGDSFKSWFAKEKDAVEVGIEFDNGFVSKTRNNSKNVYDINDTIFEAVKSDIPKDLADIVNLSDYNTQTQFLPYFLLQDTAGEVAKRFNELIGLDIIDTLFKNLNSSISNLKGRIVDYDRTIKGLETNVNSLAYLDDIEVIIKNLDLEVGLKEKVEMEQVSVSETIHSIEELDRKLSEIEIDPELPNKIKEIKEQIDHYINLRTEYDVIASGLHNLKTTEEELTAETEWLEVEKTHNEINILLINFENINKTKTKIKSLINSIEFTNKGIEIKNEHISTCLLEYKTELSKSKVCPFCYEPITKESFKHIEKHLGE